MFSLLGLYAREWLMVNCSREMMRDRLLYPSVCRFNAEEIQVFHKNIRNECVHDWPNQIKSGRWRVDSFVFIHWMWRCESTHSHFSSSCSTFFFAHHSFNRGKIILSFVPKRMISSRHLAFPPVEWWNLLLLFDTNDEIVPFIYSEIEEM